MIVRPAVALIGILANMLGLRTRVSVTTPEALGKGTGVVAVLTPVPTPVSWVSPPEVAVEGKPGVVGLEEGDGSMIAVLPVPRIGGLPKDEDNNVKLIFSGGVNTVMEGVADK